MNFYGQNFMCHSFVEHRRHIFLCIDLSAGLQMQSLKLNIKWAGYSAI